MLLTGHQPNYLPYPGLFHKIAIADAFIIVDNVQFVKRGPFGWMNRNKIRTKDGWGWLTVPVITKGKFTQSILETKINNNLPWGRKHWRAIKLNYSKAAYFDKYAGFLEPIYEKRWEGLCELNIEMIKILLQLLGIKKDVMRTSTLGIRGESTQLIINMCKKVGASAYLSGIHGRDYLDENLMGQNNIKLVYQKFSAPQYQQCQRGPFIPNLSIIDMLFNCGEGTLKLLLRDENIS